MAGRLVLVGMLRVGVCLVMLLLLLAFLVVVLVVVRPDLDLGRQRLGGRGRR